MVVVGAMAQAVENAFQLEIKELRVRDHRLQVFAHVLDAPFGEIFNIKSIGTVEEVEDIDRRKCHVIDQALAVFTEDGNIVSPNFRGTQHLENVGGRHARDVASLTKTEDDLKVYRVSKGVEKTLTRVTLYESTMRYYVNVS